MVFYLYGHETSLNYVYLHFLNVKDEILNENDSQHLTIGKVMEKKIIIISNEMVPFILKLNTENYCIFIKQSGPRNNQFLLNTTAYYQYFLYIQYGFLYNIFPHLYCICS